MTQIIDATLDPAIRAFVGKAPAVTADQDRTRPSEMAPTRTSVRSHGMCGWSHAIQARCVPSGERSGWATKSLSATISFAPIARKYST